MTKGLPEPCGCTVYECCQKCDPAAYERMQLVTLGAPTKTRPEDQPLPTASDSPSMHDLVAADLMERKALGIRRYGRALQANNGRDGLLDHYQELLDATAYARQLLYERDGR